MQYLTRRALLTAGAGLAAAIAGCTRERPLINEQIPSGSTAAPHTAALQEVLARRTQAVLTGDEALFMADLDRSNAALSDRQRLLFANLRQFSWAKFGYVVPPNQQPAPHEGGWRCTVVGLVQLSIDDTGTGVLPGETFHYTIAQRDGRWVVTDIVAKTADNADTFDGDAPRADTPWHTTALTLTKVGQVWLAADVSVTDLDRYTAAAAAEAQRVQSLWGARIAYPGCLLFLTRDSEAFKSWYGFGKATNFRDTVEGVAPHRLGVRTNGEPYRDQYAAARAVVNLKRVDAAGDDPSLIMRHELAHAITARGIQAGAGFADLYSAAPTWAVEGFAAFTETLDNPARAQLYRDNAGTGFDGKLPRSPDFYTTNVAAHYAQGATAFLYAQQLKGLQAAVELYASTVKYADFAGEPLAQLPVFDGVCKRVLGIGAQTFVNGWANYVRTGR